MEIWNHIPGSLRVFFLIFLFFLFFATGLLLYPKVRTVKEPVEVVLTPKIREVTIYITGMIKKPGVYTLKKGDRVINAIKKAGGPLKGWDPQRINLARKLKDQEMIVVPGKKEILQKSLRYSDKVNRSKQYHWKKYRWKNHRNLSWHKYAWHYRYRHKDRRKYQHHYWEHPIKHR